MIERLASGALCTLLACWVGATFWLRSEHGVPNLWLPLTTLAGTAATIVWARRAAKACDATPRPPGWALALSALVVVATLLPLVDGALATPSRHWDGAASFDAKVAWLTRTPTLQQPFFTAPGVFHHSPDYPLLLPLLTALLDRLLPGCGRLTMPLCWLLLGAITLGCLRRRAVAPTLQLAATTGLLLTPMLLSPGGGAVDSGYSELPLLLATTAAASALLTGRAPMLAVATALMVASKPEGLPYAGLLIATAFVGGQRHLLVAAVAGTCTALWLWSPVQRLLLHQPAGPPTTALLVLLAGAALMVLDGWHRRRGHGARARGATLAIPAMIAFAALPLLAPLAGDDQGTLAVYLRRGTDAFDGLANLPAWAAATVDYAFARLRYGLLPLLAVAVWLFDRRDRPTADPAVDRLLLLLLLGVLMTALPFVLSPEPDLAHHLRSSLPRLLLHWIGPIWLWVGTRTGALLRLNAADPARPRPTPAAHRS